MSSSDNILYSRRVLLSTTVLFASEDGPTRLMPFKYAEIIILPENVSWNHFHRRVARRYRPQRLGESTRGFHLCVSLMALFSGPIPEQLRALTQLYLLLLSNNKLTGEDQESSDFHSFRLLIVQLGAWVRSRHSATKTHMLSFPTRRNSGVPRRAGKCDAAAP